MQKKYHDFPEMATESISAYTKVENEKTVPMWTKEEVDEIVAGQVHLDNIYQTCYITNSASDVTIFQFRALYSFWLDLTRQLIH